MLWIWTWTWTDRWKGVRSRAAIAAGTCAARVPLLRTRGTACNARRHRGIRGHGGDHNSNQVIGRYKVLWDYAGDTDDGTSLLWVFWNDTIGEFEFGLNSIWGAVSTEGLGLLA